MDGHRGGGDAEGGIFVSHGTSWGDLPDDVLLHIFQYLDGKSLCSLRGVMKRTQFVIDYGYGMHAVIPARKWKCLFPGLQPKSKDPQIPTRTITDSTVRKAWLRLKGKKVRSLVVDEMPTGLSVIPFGKNGLIQYPYGIADVSFKYVDISLIFEVLCKCRQLRSLQYSTGVKNHFPNGPLSLLLVGSWFAPPCVPSWGLKFISYINKTPTPRVELGHLTKFELHLGKIDRVFYSDWQNAIYLLLALPPTPNLREFSFEFSPDRALSTQDYYVIMGCMAQFLYHRGSLRNLTISSLTFASELELNASTGMISTLIGKFGSESLRLLSRSMTEGVFQLHIQNMFREAGQRLENLSYLEFLRLGVPEETNMYLPLLENLPGVKSFKARESKRNPLFELDNEENFADANAPHLFLSPSTMNVPRMPIHQTIESLSIDNYSFGGDIAPLHELLTELPRLNSLEINYDMKCYWKDLSNVNKRVPANVVEEKHNISTVNENGEVEVITGTRYVQRPTFRILPFQNRIPLERLQSLNLSGLHILSVDIERLVHCKHLKELKISNRPGYKSKHFHIHSKTLINLLAGLRQLNKIFVQPLWFDSDQTARFHKKILKELGALRLAPESRYLIYVFSFGCQMKNP